MDEPSVSRVLARPSPSSSPNRRSQSATPMPSSDRTAANAPSTSPASRHSNPSPSRMMRKSRRVGASSSTINTVGGATPPSLPTGPPLLSQRRQQRGGPDGQHDAPGPEVDRPQQVERGTDDGEVRDPQRE